MWFGRVEPAGFVTEEFHCRCLALKSPNATATGPTGEPDRFHPRGEGAGEVYRRRILGFWCCWDRTL